MNYQKIEELFVDFILELIGPSKEKEKEGKTIILIIKKVIINIFNSKFPEYNIYLMPYGSFPSKTYLKDSDIDLTILLELKTSKQILSELPINLINQAFTTIKEGLEKYNNKISYEFFTDIKIIPSNIQLLKCKIGLFSIDITINNFSGLNKILFFNYIENILQEKFEKNKLFFDLSYSKNKIVMFRRTLLLIKGWCFYEGKLMGSNIGLMANYTLEILIIYIFNLHYKYIYNEFDGFEKFFEILEKINLEKNVISLFGIISKINFLKALSDFNSDALRETDINQPFWYFNKKYKNITFNNEKEIDNEKLNQNSYESLLNLDNISKFLISINNSLGKFYLQKEGKIINMPNYDKFINILDPMNNHNNLGKSINYHSYEKMKKVIKYINKKLKQIQSVRKKGNPFLYINSLLNLFNITLSKNFIELFSLSLSTSKIISNSKFLKFSNKENNINIDKEEIDKFNKLFSFTKENNNINKIESEDEDEFFEDNEEENDCEEEDEYAKEEEEDDEDNNNEGEQNFINEEKINFPNIINNDIIKKLYEHINNIDININYYNLLLKESNEYEDNLEIFLKEHKIFM